MNKQNELLPVSEEEVISRILLIRGKRVILDTDLADLYGVPTKRLNEQVRRNVKRFPSHFMFRITKEEKKNVVAICGHLEKLKYSSFLPYAFTEYGVLMVANVLNNNKAIRVSIKIVEIFIKMHEMVLEHKGLLVRLNELEQKVSEHDDRIILVLEYIKQLEKSKQEEQDFKKKKEDWLLEK